MPRALALLLATFLVQQQWQYAAASVTTVNDLNDSSSGDCSDGSTTCNLRAAVALADGIPIFLSEGTHVMTEGAITINNDTKIYGNGDHLVVIDGTSNADRLFTVSSGVKLSIEGVKISDFSSSDSGACIYSEGTVVTSNSTFEDCSTSVAGSGNDNGGGAIFGRSGSVYASNVTFNRNSAADANGGAVFVHELSVLDVSDSLFTNNQAKTTGGAVAYRCESVSTNSIIKGSHFKSNTANKGGGLGFVSSYRRYDLAVTDSNFDENVAYLYGGGISVLASSNENIAATTFTVTDSDFNGNKVLRKGDAWSYDISYGGGAIQTYRSSSASPRLDTVISGCSFVDSFSWCNGGALYMSAVEESADFTTDIQDGTIFKNNNASHYGNDIYSLWGQEPTCTVTACEAGTFINQTYLADCYNAASDSSCSCTFRQTCGNCEVGTFSDTSDATRCKNCTAGSVATVASSACTDCQAGTYAAASGDACSDCEAGTYQSESVQTACDLCGQGTYNNNTGSSSSADCVECPAGRYNNHTGSTALNDCVRCGVGKYSETLGAFYSTTCIDCASGKYLNWIGASSTCDCTDCASGFHSSKAGSEKCDICKAGTSAYAGSTSCSACVAGTYSNVSGSETCTDCSSGTVSLDYATNCTVCDAGKYTTEKQDSCALCTAGTYSNERGATSCSDCSKGKTSSSPFLACTNCTAGKYATNDASTFCATCSGSGYSSEGASECLTCIKGSYLQVDNVTRLNVACSLCEAGTISTVAGLLRCDDCDAGTYSSAAGATECTSCEAGSYAAHKGASQCEACPSGEISEEEAASACSPCNTGTFSNGTGSTECLECPTGTTTSSDGMTECDICDILYYTPDSDIRTSYCDVYGDCYKHAVCDLCENIVIRDSAGVRINEGKAEIIKCNKKDVTLSTLPIEPGFWRDNIGAMTIHECLNADACKQKTYNETTTDSGGRRLSTEITEDFCEPGYYGPLCAVCARGETEEDRKRRGVEGEEGKVDYYLTSQYECLQCNGETGLTTLSSTNAWKLFGTTMLVLVIVGALYYNKESIKKWMKDNNESYENVSTHATILAITYQILVEFTAVHVSSGGEGIASPFKEWLSFFDFLSFDVLQVVPITCIEETTYVSNVLVMTLTPLILTLIAGSVEFFQTKHENDEWEKLEEVRSAKLLREKKVTVCLEVVLSSHHEKNCPPTLPWCRGNKSEGKQGKLAEDLEHVMGTYKLSPEEENGSFCYTKEGLASNGAKLTLTLFKDDFHRWKVKRTVEKEEEKEEGYVLRCETPWKVPLSKAGFRWEYQTVNEAAGRKSQDDELDKAVANAKKDVDDQQAELDKAVADAKKAVDTQQAELDNLTDLKDKNYKPKDPRVVEAEEKLAGLEETLAGLKKEDKEFWTVDDDISCDGVKIVSKGPLRACWQMFYYILPTVSTVIFQCIPCRYFGDETGLSDDDYTDKYLAIDYRVACDSDKYTMMKLYAYIMILVYPVGVPLSFAILLGRQRHLINPIGAIERKQERLNIKKKVKKGELDCYEKMTNKGYEAQDMLFPNSGKKIEDKLFPTTEKKIEHMVPALLWRAATEARGGAGIDKETCVICVKPVVAPVELPCGHACCGACLAELRTKKVAQACPLCTVTLHNLSVPKAINLRNQCPDIGYLRFLFKPYELEYWWFSSVDLVRRLLLTAFLLYWEDPNDQIIYALAVCLVFVNIYRETNPYAHREHNTSINICQWQILMCVIAVLLLETELISAEVSQQTAVGWFLLCLNLFSIGIIFHSQQSKVGTPKEEPRAANLRRTPAGQVLQDKSITPEEEVTLRLSGVATDEKIDEYKASEEYRDEETHRGSLSIVSIPKDLEENPLGTSGEGSEAGGKMIQNPQEEKEGDGKHGDSQVDENKDCAPGLRELFGDADGQ